MEDIIIQAVKTFCFDTINRLSYWFFIGFVVFVAIWILLSHIWNRISSFIGFIMVFVLKKIFAGIVWFVPLLGSFIIMIIIYSYALKYGLLVNLDLPEISHNLAMGSEWNKFGNFTMYSINNMFR